MDVSTRSHLSDYEQDALRLGLLDGEGRSRAERHLEDCARCRDRAERLAAEAARVAGEVDVEVAARRAYAASSARSAARRRLRRVAAGVVALAAAASVAIVAWPEGDAVRRKGSGSRVAVFVVDGSRLRAASGGPVPASATLRLQVVPRNKPYVRLSWAGEPLWPPPGEPAARVESARFVPHEIVLDGALQPETLEAVFCDNPFAAGVAAPGCDVYSVVVTKR